MMKFTNIEQKGGSTRTQSTLIDKLYIEEESFLATVEKNLIANEFGLGYTFIQYKDDSGELLSTLQIYTLPGDYKNHYKSVIESLTSNTSITDLLLIPLLDYTDNPHSWLTFLRSWLSTVHSLFFKENFDDLQNLYTTQHKNLEEGVYDIPLGVQVLIIVANTETRPDWEHSIVEFIQSVLRIIALKHGTSLLFTSLLRADPRIIQLISNLLDIEITQKLQNTLEPNLVDHTEILVPVGIDSWGKIQTVSDDLNTHELSKEWNLTDDNNQLIERYQNIVPDLSKPLKPYAQENGSEQIVQDMSYQEFLAKLYDKTHKSQEKILKKFIRNVQSKEDAID